MIYNFTHTMGYLSLIHSFFCEHQGEYGMKLLLKVIHVRNMPDQKSWLLILNFGNKQSIIKHITLGITKN